MLSGKLYVICGLSRLSARVARSLRAQNANVTVIMFHGEKESLTQILPDGVQVISAAGENAVDTLLKAHADKADCLLALSEEDIANLRSMVSLRSVAPDVPVVIRAFDPKLADQFEQGLNVRRAFSVSALAAPAFAAAACGARIIDSLRLGDEVVPINVIQVTKESHLRGMPFKEFESHWNVSIVAHHRIGGEWIFGAKLDENGAVEAGDQLVLSGAPSNCMNLLAFGAGWRHRQRQSRMQGRRGVVAMNTSRARRRQLTWLPQFVAVLAVLIVTSVIVFMFELHLDLIDAVYFVVTTVTTTGYGDISVLKAPAWVKLFNILLMLSGGALLGVLFSWLASIATTERLEVTMARRAEQMNNHIVIIGLGNVGYRTAMTLVNLGIDVVVMDVKPQARFFESVSARAPVLTGDARLPDTLERAAIRNAAAIIACTSDDLANIEACLHARRLNPDIQTVARVFDDQIVATLSDAFNIDAVLSATHAAESSFVVAATDAAALRPLKLNGLALVAGRYRSRTSISAHEVRAWSQRNIQALAFRSEDGQLTSHLASPYTYEAIICGDEAVIRDIIKESDIGSQPLRVPNPTPQKPREKIKARTWR